ncbi:hypothetical protein SAMN04489806_3080 [Paramicrobacterium humi]|uniref:Uncharacterized protein n=1 Tax=Paramicrobacterium humi TaxID=640635 RepID=A0A1H4T1Z0_9MICO|nr:DUF6186 family protein [Microbacterium humi]SEC50503.1 hypothetical protein SAMN04489806_3080 [Microbacterium humi]
MYLMTLGAYVLCLAAAIVFIIWSHRSPETMTRPSTLIDALFVSRAARIAVIVFWWWIGWHFLFAQTLDG